MRSKNQVPVQVILPQSQMSGNHSTPRAGFEEALQSSIEASLRINGTAPSLHIFSLLYHQSKPQQSGNPTGPANSLFQNNLSFSDNGDTVVDVKPDISDLNREINRQSRSAEDQGTVDEAREAAHSGHSAHSSSSLKDSQNDGSGNYSMSSRGPPPLLVPNTFAQPPAVTSNSNETSVTRNTGNMQIMPRLPSIIPNNIQHIEQLKKAQEQVKQLQQLQKWRLLHQHQARAAVANSLSQIPRLPFFNPLIPSSGLNRNAFPKHVSSINGVPETITSLSQTSPGSPMFRKGYCKGGKDIRLSSLQQDGSLVSYPAGYSLVALSISPSVPQVVKPSGGYQPPDIPAEGMVVVAINSMCLPPQQTDYTRPVLAQCIGCGDATLVSFAALASHANLRSTTPTSGSVNQSEMAFLQRHARHFVLREASQPHACVRGAIIPWPVGDTVPSTVSSTPRSSMQSTLRVPQLSESGTSFVTPTKNEVQIDKQELLHPPVSTQMISSALSIPQREAAVNSQSDAEFLQSCITANGMPECKFRMDWSPISSDNSDPSSSQSLPLCENVRSLAWNPTVKLPECFPEFVGLPLILICWEWQLLQSNINNIHITRSFTKCFQEVLSSKHNTSNVPLSKEMCFFIVTQYLISLAVHEFPIPSILSSWFSRAQQLLDTIPQVLSDGKSFINLAKVALANARDRIGLVTSQKSQAHAINECIAKLKQGGPTCHIIAHVNGNSVLDLSILLTGQTSRLTREFILSDGDESKFIQRLCTTEVFHEIEQKLSASSHWLGNDAVHPLSSNSSVNSLRQFFPSTSNVAFSYGYTENRILHDSTSKPIDNKLLDKFDKIASDISSEDEAIANRVCDKLFSHVSSIFTNSSTELALSHFSSIQCYFLLPPSSAGVIETVADITTSKLIPELANLAMVLELADARDLVITTESCSNERFRFVHEQITQDSSTLFILFCADSHVHCDKTSLGAEWIMKLMQHQNVFVIYSTYIPQALLNRNTSIRKENVVLCETDLQSSNNHCLPTVSYDANFESRNTSLSERLPTIHSLMIKAQLVLSDYISSIKIYLSNMHNSNRIEETDMEILRYSSSPLTYSNIRNLLSSRTGTSILLRIPHESIAEKIADDLIDMREKMRLQNMFEIMLYSNNQKPYISDHFLQVIKRFKKKSDNWQPEALSEIDCIPLILIYTGKTVITQSLPCNINHVDLRLLGMSSTVLTQSTLVAEMSLVKSGLRFVFDKSTKWQEEPEVKKSRGSDSDDGALCVDTFSDDSLNQEDHLKWKSLDQKSPEHQPAIKNEKTCESSRKRKRDQSDDAPDQVVIRRPPSVIVCEDLYPYIMAFLKQSEKFKDLAPHYLTQWRHGRVASNGEQKPVYFRKWTQPLQHHLDFDKPDLTKDVSRSHERRSILLVTSTAARVAYGCCLFVKQLNRKLKNLLQVEAYDYMSSSVVKPSYPLLNDDTPLQWPVYTTILDMDYDTSIGRGTVVNASRITNGITPIDLKTTSEPPPTKSQCMIGRYPAHDIEHRRCNSCRQFESSIQATTHPFVLTNCGPDDGFGTDRDNTLTLKFVIPVSEKHHFVFDFDNVEKNNVKAIALTRKDETGIKTPVFSLGIHGAHNGLYNLDHMLRKSFQTQCDDNSNDCKRPVHIIVVRQKDLDEYLRMWPNKILMILPEDFDDLATGAMKYAVQLAMSHSLSVLQDQNRSQSGYSSTGDIWPFAMFLDDSVVMWTSTYKMPLSSLRESDAVAKWQSVSLLEILERIESLPCVERYAAIGFRNWSSQMTVPCSEESFSGELLSSKFSKCLLSSSFVINAGSTKDELFDYTKFLHEDTDWCIRIAAADMAVLRFNDVAFASKALPMSDPESSAISCSNPEAFINLADAKYSPIQKHPHQLLETFLCHLGHHVFPCAKGNVKHPILVIDRYISLGTEVYVEYACSKPGALPWAVDSEKTYSGLLLYCQSSEISLSFLQQFKFTEGATVCIVGRDRSSLRQTVVNLHLENEWHFRLTDEYQTANDPSSRKPLFYLTGVSRLSR